MLKNFIKKYFFALVWIKRKVYFALFALLLRLDVFRVQRILSCRVCRLRAKEKVRCAFMVMSSEEFQLEGVFRLMLNDPSFDPFVIIVPHEIDNDRHGPNKTERASFDYLRKRYGKCVMDRWQNGRRVDIVPLCDICVSANPYDGLTYKLYQIKTLARRGIPVVQTNYFCYTGTTYSIRNQSHQPSLSYVWRYYAENASWADIIRKNHTLLAAHGGVVLSGFPKIDLMAEIPRQTRKRKLILLCPHHSVREGVLPNHGNFIQYSNFILSLPKLYPSIDFVFRPHGLLQDTLEKNGIWPQGKWDSYIEELCANPNVSYIPNGPYYDLFVNSDGMIQDCGSFLAEYHCSGHPQCYVVKNESHKKSQFQDWGLELLEHAYVAENEQAILKFIDDVILNGNDWKAQARETFVKEKMLPNYPHVSEWIFNDLKKALGR